MLRSTLGMVVPLLAVFLTRNQLDSTAILLALLLGLGGFVTTLPIAYIFYRAVFATLLQQFRHRDTKR